MQAQNAPSSPDELHHKQCAGSSAEFLLLLSGGPSAPAAGAALAVPGQSSGAPPAAVAAQQLPGAAWPDRSRVPDRMRSWAPGASGAASPGRSQRALLGPPDAEQPVGGIQAPGATPFPPVVHLKSSPPGLPPRCLSWAAVTWQCPDAHNLYRAKHKQDHSHSRLLQDPDCGCSGIQRLC